MTQPAPSPRSSRGMRITGAALLVFALGLFALGIFRILEDRALTASAQGEVLSTFIDEGFDARGRQDICNHQVRYLEGPGGTANATSGGVCRAAVGETVTVFYDPANPTHAEFEGGSYKWGDLAGISVLAAVVGLPGWFLLRR